MTTSDEIVSQPQIGMLVSRVFSSFQSLLPALHLESPEGAVVVSHLARFKLWVGTLGAHRLSGSRSLEYRLRDASSIKNHIVSLLRDLCDSVDEAISAANGTTEEEERGDSGGGSHLDDAGESATAELEAYFRDDDTRGASELSNVLQEVGHTIDCLLRLSITIRNPTPHDHFRSRAGVELVDLYEPWDVKHAREKFPNADPGITERLGKATSRRRQYFKYREEHAGKLAEGLDEPGPETSEAPDGEKATTIASSIPRHLKGIEATDNVVEFDDSESNVSKTSYAPSSTDETLLRVPPLPKEYLDGPFKCPFCCMIVSIHTRRDWKKHVFRDLRPYVCLSGSCGTPEQQYLRRGDWINHMQQDHWRTWRCPFACPQLFPTKLAFVAHIQQFHAAEAPAQNMDTLENLSSQPDLEKAKGECPLCTAFIITSDKQYGSHVAAHLEQLALFALPGVAEGGDAGDDDDSNVNEDVDVEKSLEDGKTSPRSAWDAIDPDTHRRDVDSSNDEGSDSGYADLRLGDPRLSLGAEPAKADGPGKQELPETEEGSVSRSPVSSPVGASPIPLSAPGPHSMGENLGYAASTILPPPDDDILMVKYKGATYEQRFTAYSIDDRKLVVGDVVNRMASIMHVDSTSKDDIILFYKGRRLIGAGSPVREYGVKNGSELLAVLGRTADGGTDADTSSEEIIVIGSEHGLDQRQNYISSEGKPVLGGPTDKIEEIMAKFNMEVYPLCAAYISDLPSDPSARQEEHRRLSEMVMQQVLLPLDTLETGGEEGARAKRKDAVRVAALVMQDLDKVLRNAEIVRNTGYLESGDSESDRVLERINGIVKHYKGEILPHCEAYIATPPSTAWAFTYDYRRLADMIKQQVLSPLRAENENLADVSADVRAAHKNAMDQAEQTLRRLSFK